MENMPLGSVLFSDGEKNYCGYLLGRSLDDKGYLIRLPESPDIYEIEKDRIKVNSNYVLDIPTDEELIEEWKERQREGELYDLAASMVLAGSIGTTVCAAFVLRDLSIIWGLLLLFCAACGVVLTP
jgi:hypothetical protein